MTDAVALIVRATPQFKMVALQDVDIHYRPVNDSGLADFHVVSLQKHVLLVLEAPELSKPEYYLLVCRAVEWLLE
ncbi:hypothetical protein CHS0354_013658 [Potamilus streckersoni]|uniref:Uncharacterized protein n=1 Tax=Potamilus streckersoni TaxID=2493646 RepID=A0AAE0VHE5_9BIVA|nr:hypothetical protein CHS0354_013658 [Potamilus streckersoni]